LVSRAYPEALSIVPDEVLAELVAEFGDTAPAVAERALRGEITWHRISAAIRTGDDPAVAVADALARDPQFLSQTDAVADQVQETVRPRRTTPSLGLTALAGRYRYDIRQDVRFGG